METKSITDWQDIPAAIPGHQQDLDVVYLNIAGLNCPRCAGRVEMALLREPGVTNAIVEYPDGLAEVTYNPTMVTIVRLIAAVQNAGDGGHHQYEARLIR